VKFISPNVRASTRDLVIEAMCPNPDLRLRPGMFAVAQLQMGEKTLPNVPKRAVKKDETSAHVFVVKGGRVEDHLVQLGGTRDDRIAVAFGVAAGDEVVLDPRPEIHDGVRVVSGR
jgi:membrane fusion protein (multidrug efflux system)